MIVEDKREIVTLYFPGEGEIKVGAWDVTKIKPYYENGEMAKVVWFEIWQGDYLWQRVSGKNVEGIVYKNQLSKGETK